MFWWAWRGVTRYWIRGSMADRITVFPVLWALVVALTIGPRWTWFGIAIRGAIAWMLTGLPRYLRARSRARQASHSLAVANPHAAGSTVRPALPAAADLPGSLRPFR